MAIKNWEPGRLAFFWLIGAALWVGGLILGSTPVPDWIRSPRPEGDGYALLALVGMIGLMLSMVIGIPIALLVITLMWRRQHKTSDKPIQ
jgi:hypothetical protein